MQMTCNQQYPTQPAVFVPSYLNSTANMPQTFQFLPQNLAQPPLQIFTVPHPLQATLPQPAVPTADPPSPEASTSSSQSDSGMSSSISDVESHGGSAITNSTMPPELATSSARNDPGEASTSPKKNISQEEILQRVADSVPGQPQTQAADFLGGPDIPLPELDLDKLIASHQESQTPPPATQDTGEDGMTMPKLLAGAKHTLVNFVKWVKMIDAFCQLPKEDRLRCVKGCWIEQMILSIVYRSLILQSGKLVTSSGAMFQAADMRHELVAYTMARIMGEVMGSFKNLELDHKEFVCVRLLLLFAPGELRGHSEPTPCRAS